MLFRLSKKVALTTCVVTVFRVCKFCETLAHLHLTETPALGDSSPGDSAMLATPLPRSRLELLPSLSLWGSKTQSLIEWCWCWKDCTFLTPSFPCDNDRAMTQAASRQPLAEESQAQYHASQCGICGRQSGNDTGFSPSTSIFFSQYHSRTIQYSFIVYQWGQMTLATDSVVKYTHKHTPDLEAHRLDSFCS
jgi:hypothetical protein